MTSHRTSLAAGICFSPVSKSKRDAIARFQDEAKAAGWEIEADVADEGGIYLTRFERHPVFGRIDHGSIDSDGNFFQRA